MEGEADGAFGFEAFFDLDLDFARCFGVTNVFGFFVSAKVGQAGEVGFGEGLELLRGEVADEDKGKVGGVAESVAIDLEGGFGVEFVQKGLVDRLASWMVLVEGFLDGVVEDDLGVVGAVGDADFELGHHGMKGFAVGAGRGEVKVNELEHSFEVLGRGGSVDRFGAFGDLRRGGGNFAGQFFLKLDEIKSADTAVGNEAGGNGGGGKVFVGDSAVSARTEGAHEDLVVFEVGGFEEDSDAVGEFPFGEAEFWVLFLRDDGSGLGRRGNQGGF